MKRLYLLRHAKASTGEPDEDDHARSLTSRGRRAADRIGDVLAARGELPEFVLCSSSRRTRETLDRVLDRLTARPRVVIEEELYLADCRTLLARVRGIPEEVERALLVGHHPGIADLTDLFITRGSREMRRRLSEKFPTAALAILGLDATHWCDVGPGAELDAFVLPRELEPT